MSKTQRGQRGQALILIVFAIIGLIGITGLAIDGGNAYSDRRNAQNAADTAALATGLTSIRHAGDSDQTAAWTTAQQAGFDRAAANGYSTSDPSKVVNIYRCDQTSLGADCQLPLPLPTGETTADYVQVTIRSTIPTYFAPVLGIRSMTNYVQAVARAVPPVEETWYDGNALVATMPGCKPNGWPDDAFVLSGGSQTNVFGISGVYVNANCPYSASFTASNNTYLHSPGICVKGTSSTGGADVSPVPTDHCTTSFDVSKYALPPVGIDSCKDSNGVTQMGHLQTISGKTYAYPGVYSGTFPPNGISGSTLYLYRGVYCLMNSPNALNWTGNIALSTDWNGNGNLADTNLEGVLFYVPNGGVTINTNMNMSAMEDSLSGALKGYLMYLPPTNTSTVSLAGNGSSTIVGTILAPAARVTISGGASGDSLGMESQVIGYSVGLSGGGALSITYNQSKNGKTWTPPMLQPYNNK